LSNGLDTFIEVIKELKDNKFIHFVIAGNGGLREKYLKDLEGYNNVQFLGKVEQKEVKNILAKCSILYFAALKSKVWQYGWSPNKLIDYMISGKPILASYSGYQSMINEANSGIFVPAEDKESLLKGINIMASMPQNELEAMGTRGREWLIENRQWETLANNYISILNKLAFNKKH